MKLRHWIARNFKSLKPYLFSKEELLNQENKLREQKIKDKLRLAQEKLQWRTCLYLPCGVSILNEDEILEILDWHKTLSCSLFIRDHLRVLTVDECYDYLFKLNKTLYQRKEQG